MDVSIWYLEQTSPDDLRRPSRAPSLPVEIVRSDVPSPEFSRFLYTAVGGQWHWTGQLPWTYDRWMKRLDRPGVETWVAWHRGTPAGYVELEGQPDGQVEIAHFGLLPAFIGRGIGGHLLAEGTARAWDLGAHWPDREPTRRVWLHTCSLDGPNARSNYEARGFRHYDTKIEQQEVPDTPPGPWPGA